MPKAAAVFPIFSSNFENCSRSSLANCTGIGTYNGIVGATFFREMSPQYILDRKITFRKLSAGFIVARGGKLFLDFASNLGGY